jgi:site-specific DNA-cytosine methylase
MSKTVATLFCGAGGSTLGAIAAGYEPIWAVDHDPKIAAIYRDNIGDCAMNDIALGYPQHLRLCKPDLLLASPSCTSFSGNNVGGVESDKDIAMAKGILDYIEELEPKYVAIENVAKYRHSVSFQLIEWWMERYGYQMAIDIIKATDHGVPQTRDRMVARFGREPLKPIMPTVKAEGWWNAIQGTNVGRPTELTCAQYKAWKIAGEPDSCIIQRVAYHKMPRLWLPNQNIGTVGAHWGDDGKPPNGHDRQALTLMIDGQCYWLTIKQLAALSGMPDDYKWSGTYRVDWRALGNIMHPAVSEAVCKSFEEDDEGRWLKEGGEEYVDFCKMMNGWEPGDDD